jgi:hypothetical protein
MITIGEGTSEIQREHQQHGADFDWSPSSG